MTTMAERVNQALLLADLIRTAPRIEISHPATVRGRRYDD
jgi:hypothetical protein